MTEEGMPKRILEVRPRGISPKGKRRKRWIVSRRTSEDQVPVGVND